MTFSPGFRWQINGRILVFVLVFLPLTLGLGLWQLQRAEQKRDILQMQQARELAAPLDNAKLADTPDLHLRRFDLWVSFDPERWFLLDNRVYQGQPGYEVLNLAQPVGSDIWLLVNRGWTPAALDRTELPDLPAPEGEVRIRGYFYAPAEQGFQLGQQQWSGRWPERIQYADLAALRSHLDDGAALVAAQLRLDAADPLALGTHWQLINQAPERHLGYAVQWFALALALVVLGLFANSNLADLLRGKRKS